MAQVAAPPVPPPIMAEAIRPPVLVRGLTETPVQKPQVAKLVEQALKACDVKVSPDELNVEDISGHGGAKTFKVASGDCAVCLHTRPQSTEHGWMLQTPEARDRFMRRMSAGSLALAHAGLAPTRLAEGSDWFLEQWSAGNDSPKHDLTFFRRFGELLARLHAVPTAWFEPFRAELTEHYGAVPPESPAWFFLARGVDFPPDFPLAEYAQAGPLLPEHPAARRLVTLHGDFHPGNAIETQDGTLQAVDFEFLCVGCAATDIANGIACCGGDEAKRTAFVQAYLEAAGFVADDAAVRQVTIDSFLRMLYLWHNGGRLAGFCVHELPRGEVLELLERCHAFARDVRSEPDWARVLLAERLEAALRKHPAFAVARELEGSKEYAALQAALEADKASEERPPPASAPRDAMVLRFRDLALQVRPGTCRLELAAPDGTPQQQWHVVGAHAMEQWQDVELRHCASGLYLDTAVQLPLYNRGKPWAGTLTELLVRPRDQSARQRWSVDPQAGGVVLRHSFDGRALDVNFWDPRPGQGVNVCAAFGDLQGQLWTREALAPAPAAPDRAAHLAQLRERGGVYQCWLVESERNGMEFVQHNYPDGSYRTFCLNGDEQVDQGFWAMQQGCYSEETGFPVSGVLEGSAESFFMRVDCGPHGPHTYTATSDLFRAGRRCEELPPEELRRRQAASAKSGWTPPRNKLADLAPDAEFLIQPAACLETCLAVRSDGYTGDPFEVFLQRVSGARAQRWRLVGDTLQHVETGKFLHSSTVYPVCRHLSNVWEGNHSNLVLRDQDGSDAQRWTYGPEEFHGGKVLRHFKDARGVDVHGWTISRDGNNVGVENAVHSDCRGNSYVFTVVSASAL